MEDELDDRDHDQLDDSDHDQLDNRADDDELHAEDDNDKSSGTSESYRVGEEAAKKISPHEAFNFAESASSVIQSEQQKMSN